MSKSTRTIAFYLPQFHPTSENDSWWGKGFTEWTNVAKARPVFPGHHQPRLPTDLGFYDLRLQEAREAQANLANSYGIHGFCYYHYWFHGKRLLNQPVDEILRLGNPDFPFCLCWANENWTRSWDGRDREVIQPQAYSNEDDLAHIRWLSQVFLDDRYIRINGKPLFVVYRVEDLPDPRRTSETWRQEARKLGVGEIYLVFVENFRHGSPLSKKLVPEEIGFDATIKFAPCFDDLSSKPPLSIRIRQKLTELGLLSGNIHTHRFFDYREIALRSMQRPKPEYRQFPCIMTGWDNSSRRACGASIFLDESPETYEKWFKEIVRCETESSIDRESFVFINAWNEWAEGTHLEPCMKWGRQYLEATKRVLDASL